MITQKPISARISNENIFRLECESNLTGIPKNRLINQAIEYLAAANDTVRYLERNWEDTHLCQQIALNFLWNRNRKMYYAILRKNVYTKIK